MLFFAGLRVAEVFTMFSGRMGENVGAVPCAGALKYTLKYTQTVGGVAWKYALWFGRHQKNDTILFGKAIQTKDSG